VRCVVDLELEHAVLSGNTLWDAVQTPESPANIACEVWPTTRIDLVCWDAGDEAVCSETIWKAARGFGQHLHARNCHRLWEVLRHEPVHAAFSRKELSVFRTTRKSHDPAVAR
jgi:hypothetical protein